MPHMDGIELTRRIVRAHPHIGVLVLSAFGESEFVEQAMRAGARGYVLKGEPSAQIVDAIDAIVKGGIYVIDPATAPAGRARR